MSVKRFLKDKNGNFSIVTAFMLAPLLAGLTIAVDYSELNRHKNVLHHALDAAGIAAAREYSLGSSVDDVRDYAVEFFNANLNDVDPSMADFTILFPGEEDNTGGTMVMRAKLRYEPYFYSASLMANCPHMLRNGACVQEALDDGKLIEVRRQMEARIRLKSTAEIALVLDNSGSMDWTGAGSSRKRLDLLKDASKQLVETLSIEARQVQGLHKPLQFSLVPFAASVNVGSDKANEPWMDTLGVSSVHHENFDWSQPIDANRTVERDPQDGLYKKTGSGWGDEENNVVTRFTLFNDMEVVERRTELVRHRERVRECRRYRRNGTCRRWRWRWITTWEEQHIDTPVKYASWQGCVEMRPWPYMVNDDPANGAHDAYYVPMFGPDEPGDVWRNDPNPLTYGAYNNWWDDNESASNRLEDQTWANKYFHNPIVGDGEATTAAANSGPNSGCTTNPITPLTETISADGEQDIKNAIDAMQAEGATNVTQGITWGWATLSSHAPFTEGRDEVERGNEKIMIVLTDGKNTYYTPQSLGRQDPASNGSIYSAYGYAGRDTPGYSDARIFQGTNVGNGLNNTNYSASMIQQMSASCENAKNSGIRIFTIALDLDYNEDGSGNDVLMAEALKDCASISRLDSDRKLFWNSRGGDLDSTFEAIADELSNLRIVG